MNRLFSWCFVLVLPFCFLQNSNATDFGSLNVTGNASGGVTVTRGSYTRVVPVPTAGAGANLEGEFQLLLKKNPIIITATRGITGAVISAGALKLAKKMGPLGLAFTLAGFFWDDILKLWTKLESDTTYPPGNWCVLTASLNVCTSSPFSSCSQYLATLSNRALIRVDPSTPTNIKSYRCVECYPNASTCTSSTVHFLSTLVVSCPVGTLYNTQTGECVALSYIPASDSELLNAITSQVNLSPSNAASQATKNLNDDEPGTVNSAGPINSVSGPSETAPITTTKSESLSSSVPDLDGDGISEEKVVNTETTTTINYNLTYNTNTVNITENKTEQVTTTTTITNSTTHTSTTTTNTTTSTTTNTSQEPIDTETNPNNPSTPSTPSTPTSSDWPTFCAWASVVCDFIDWVKQEPSIPDDPILPVEDLASSMENWSLNLGPGSCPSDVNVPLPQGQSMVFSYAIPCNILSTYIAPIVLLMSAILASYILAGVKFD